MKRHKNEFDETILGGIQFTKRFIEFVFMEMNQMFYRNPNVICP